MNNNQGYFLFPETRLGPFRDEFEKTLDAYDSDEINETNYVNKLRRLAWHHWYSRSSGICICALYAAILANVHLQRHQDAVILIDKILTYNPENNQGTRWLLGAELLRAGKHGRALYVLTGHVNEFPPYWYELALLHFMNEAYINAATAFRYGFLTSIYCWNALLESLSIP